eukprot:1911655-Pleurochrysis_carterae.AAC.1
MAASRISSGGKAARAGKGWICRHAQHNNKVPKYTSIAKRCLTVPYRERCKLFEAQLLALSGVPHGRQKQYRSSYGVQKTPVDDSATC